MIIGGLQQRVTDSWYTQPVKRMLVPLGSISTVACSWSSMAAASPPAPACWPTEKLDDALGLTDLAGAVLSDSNSDAKH
jgi:hypothetical protein